MEFIFYILAKVVSIFLSLVSLSMLLRVILGFFVDVQSSKLYMFCTCISEPFILPFRLLCAKLNIGQNSPLDIPFFIAYLTLSFISIFLPVI